MDCFLPREVVESPFSGKFGFFLGSVASAGGSICCHRSYTSLKATVTWNPKMKLRKMIFLFTAVIFGVGLSLQDFARRQPDDVLLAGTLRGPELRRSWDVQLRRFFFEKAE